MALRSFGYAGRCSRCPVETGRTCPRRKKATPTAPEASAPVLEAVAPQLACARCRAPLPASTGPGRPRTLCDDCRGQKRPRCNGQSGDVKPDARPLKIPDYDSPEVRQALEPPPLPWQTR